LEWHSPIRDPRRVGRPTNDPIAARGQFAIEESCYIADTGHFNAVEYNICYNQLIYTLVGACIDRGLLSAFSDWTLEEFRRRQLPDFLIVRLESEFRSPMQSGWFEAVVRIERVSARKGTVIMNTSSEFFAVSGGRSRGTCLVAVVNEPLRSSRGDRSRQMKERNGTDTQVDGAGVLVERLRSAPARQRPRLMADYLKIQIARRAGVDVHEVEPRGPLIALGMSSLKAVEMKAELERQLQTALPSSILFDCPTLETLVPFLLERAGLAVGASERDDRATERAPTEGRETESGVEPGVGRRDATLAEELAVELRALGGQS
jgi:hypothetical protein